MVRVKICGITNLADARHAAECGADALGFIFAESPRRVDVRTALKIVREIGPWVATVGVFVDEHAARIRQIVKTCGLTAVQLHGKESPAAARQLTGLKRIKAFRAGAGVDWKKINTYPAEAFLFDTSVGGRFGGTGQSFNWALLKKRPFTRPLIVSGGLGPSNVREAVRMLTPYGVDASSALERSPGKKDPRLVKEFIQNAKKT